MPTNLGVVDARKSEESEEEVNDADEARPRGRSGEVGFLRGVRIALARPDNRTLGSTPARTYLSWAVVENESIGNFISMS